MPYLYLYFYIQSDLKSTEKFCHLERFLSLFADYLLSSDVVYYMADILTKYSKVA